MPAVVRCSVTPQGAMPTQWPLCTAIGNEGDGEHAIAIMATHSSCSPAGGRSFQAEAQAEQGQGMPVARSETLASPEHRSLSRNAGGALSGAGAS